MVATGRNFTRIAWNWVEDNRRDIRKCGNCFYTEDHDYFALYEITMAIGEAQFSWHVPYPLGKEWLPPKDSLQALPVVERDFEGAFLFGRPINDVEDVLWPVRRLEKGIGALLALFGAGEA